MGPYHLTSKDNRKPKKNSKKKKKQKQFTKTPQKKIHDMKSFIGKNLV